VEFSGERPLDQEKESEWVFHREMPWLPKQYRDSGSHSLKFYQHLHGMREIKYRDSGSHSLKFYQHLHGMREIK
jgi:hypothetical protein